MYNEKQVQFFQKQGQDKLIEKKSKEKKSMTYRFLLESEQYRAIKEEIFERINRIETFEPTQEGALKALCHSKYIEGIKEFFSTVERKAK